MIVYKIINKINNKIYIGQTIKPLKYRWSCHVSKSKYLKTPLANAIKKYGLDNFEIKPIIKANSLDELNYREEFCIKLYKATDRTIGYNIKGGGQSHTIPKRIRQKISNTLSGRKQPPRTPQHCLNLSKAKRGQKPSENTLNAMRKSIICIETGEIFKSIADASRKFKKGTSNICKNLKGKAPHCGGYHFKYMEEK